MHIFSYSHHTVARVYPTNPIGLKNEFYEVGSCFAKVQLWLMLIHTWATFVSGEAI